MFLLCCPQLQYTVLHHVLFGACSRVFSSVVLFFCPAIQYIWFCLMLAEILASFQIRGKKMEQLADEHPDLREAYMSKVANYQKYGSTLANKENVTKALDDLEGLMDKVEEQLKKVEAGEGLLLFKAEIP